MDYQTTNSKKNDRSYNNYLPPSPSIGRNIVDALTPTFRSVGIVSGSPSMNIRHVDHQPLKNEHYISREAMYKTPGCNRPNDVQTANNIAQKHSSIQQIIHVQQPEFRPISIKATWENPKLKTIPKYYPLESSMKVFHENETQRVLSNLSESFRMLGIHAKYFESPAGAALVTAELVEMHLYLWKSSDCKKQIYVELQRRRGDSVTFHRYARSILEAASCRDVLDKNDSATNNNNNNNESQYLCCAEQLFQTELPKCDNDMVESLEAIELAADLLQKDRFDARILGMESLSILTDPFKTTFNTARLASQAVLFGSKDNYAFSVIQEFILNIVQNRSMSDEDSIMEGLMDYDSDDDDEGGEEKDGYNGTMPTFVNYALKIVSNALQVLTTSMDTDQTDNRTVVERFNQISLAFSQKQDILTTLLKEVSCAESKPHNACLAGKCLKIMCESSSLARLRTKALFGIETATRAEEIGKVTNARLQEVCGELQQVLAVS